MSTSDEINDLIVGALSPSYLEVLDESHRHNVPDGAQSHFKLVIVADVFRGQSLISRHRVVNKVLAKQLEGSVHALGLHTHTPEEWTARGGEVPASPPCRGGSTLDG